ncbi:MAG: sensor histidine kinase [Enterovibrio sp.]
MDITNSLLGNEQLQVLRYKQVLSVMPAGVILLDPLGRVAEANPEAYRLLGSPLENERWLDVIARAFAPREDDGHEVSLHDGRKVKLAISASPHGQLILITDMTETRQLQARLSDLQRLSSLGKMIASLAHQVRTPLAGALLYAANLSSPKLTQENRDRFQSKLLDRLYDIEKQVNDMLLFAKGGDNKVTHLFWLTELIEQFLPMVEAMVESAQAQLELTLPSEPVALYGNANALAGALANLVINAIQVCEVGCEIKLIAQLQQDKVQLNVIDNGPGIAYELQQKVLEPFFTTRAQGTGLGLAVVQMVCHAHKGRLTLQSTPGQGTCFSLTLPLARGDNYASHKESACESKQRINS